MALAEEGLLVFDSGAAAWTWDLARIRAKGYTDNVVDLMTGKLIRLPDTTQEALGQLACLGNVAEIATLTLVHGESEEQIHAALWETVRAGLVFRLDSTYAFLHDRVQEAAVWSRFFWPPEIRLATCSVRPRAGSSLHERQSLVTSSTSSPDSSGSSELSVA